MLTITVTEEVINLGDNGGAGRGGNYANKVLMHEILKRNWGFCFFKFVHVVLGVLQLRVGRVASAS
jgi:hypothetical protein